MTTAKTTQQEKPTLTVSDYRVDMQHYWTRLMWYRDELWRVTTPIFTAYAAFVASLLGYLYTEVKMQPTTIVNMMIILAAASYVILRLYFIYSSRIYQAIKYLNHELEIREQRIYREFKYFSDLDGDTSDFASNYRKFKVFPELNVLFGIVVILMSLVIEFIMFSTIKYKTAFYIEIDNFCVLILMFILCGGFELYVKTYTTACDIDSKMQTKDAQSQELCTAIKIITETIQNSNQNKPQGENQK